MPRRPSVTLLLCAAALTPAVRAQAQSPAAAYWRALERAESVEEAGRVRLPGGLAPELARGLGALRRYELAPRAREGRVAAQGLADWAADYPSDPDGQLALGLALARGPDVRVRAFEDRAEFLVDANSLAWAGALRALRAAASGEEAREVAGRELAALALLAHDDALAAAADSVLARAVGVDALLARVDLRLRANDLAGAGELLDSVPAGGADPARLLHRRAELLLRTGRAEAGAAAYFKGAALLTPSSLAEYGRVLAPILEEPWQRDEWQALPASGRAGWLREFWERSAAAAGVSVAERLEVHYRRLAAAHGVFPLRDAMGARLDVFRLAVDPRRFNLTSPGLLLVRHGDPFRTEICLPDSVLADTARTPEPELLRPGRAAEAIDGQRALLAPPRQLASYLPQGARLAPEQRAATRELLPPELRLPCIVQQHAASLSGSLPSWQAALRRAERRARDLAVGPRLASRESYFPVFDPPLPFAYELYAFRGEGDATALLAALALPRAAQAVLGGTGAGAARLSLIVLGDSAGVARTDRTIAVAAPGAGVGRDLLVQAQLKTGLRGRVQYRVAVRGPEGHAAGGIARGELELRDLWARGPQLSDLLLGSPAGGQAWRRGAVELTPAPLPAFRAGVPVPLYYEVYGLSPETPCRTEILIARDDPGLWARARSLLSGRNVVRLRFDEAAGPVHPVYGMQALRSVGTADLEPGRYRLQVTLTDLRTGREVSAARVLVVTDR